MKKTLLSLSLLMVPLFGLTIAEKRETLSADSSSETSDITERLEQTNQELSFLHQRLEERFVEVKSLKEEGATDAEFESLLHEVKEIKAQITEAEKSWRNAATSESKQDEEGYGLWDQEETTLSQLVMEYGSGDFLYLIPPEIMNMKIDLHSNVPIPRESWSELLEILLNHNGVGMKQINPYTRQLFILRQNLMAVQAVVSSRRNLEMVADHSRIVYIFSPPPEQLKSVAHFFERFRDPKRTFIYQVSQKIAIVSTKEDIDKLLSLYDAVWEKENDKTTRVISFSKISPVEVEKILKAFFGEGAGKGRVSLTKGANEGLTVVNLSHENSVVLVGARETVDRAEKVVRETEDQVDDPTEKTVFWYKCRHSDPVDLAEVLEKVYSSLVYTSVETGGKGEIAPPHVQTPTPYNELPPPPVDYDGTCNTSQYPAAYEPTYTYGQQLPTYGPPPCPPAIQPPAVKFGTLASQERRSMTNNFVPYDKTGAILMVVRRDTLPKLKELLRKLDVPKKMVQIEVLLFEKRVQRDERSGLNFLKLGTAATNKNEAALSYESGADSLRATPRSGLIDFLWSHKKTKYSPAFDLAYSFLMKQTDIRLNASPTVTTINQVPAKISVVEEISINNGAAPLNTADGQVTFEKSFSRDQFGINVVVTPTVHEPDADDPASDWYITMETNINFDTPERDPIDDRPKVGRRKIENTVRVTDGQTLILGGLRRKLSEDRTEKIPFLGEIPGIAKLFGTERLQDEDIEMFFFITPKVIVDPKTEADKLRDEVLMKRPGDIPEFYKKILEAKRCKKEKIFARSWHLIFGTFDDEWCD